MSILKKELKPIIINTDSNFVVITYWWGNGNINKNTQRPCPEDLEKDDKVKVKPITFDNMITEWKKSCRKAKCNYMAIEYEEFAQKGMYQKAINFKPLFISEALKACYPRAVLYIDGDMHIKKYPKLFDIPNIDYMAQGWNSDPRYRVYVNDESSACYFPYVFETSGGTMYFNNTKQAKMLLREWSTIVKKYPLKADDRLISQVFNNKKLLLPLTTIQLPLEYLWLSMDYDILPFKLKSFITHPECLTGEDRAFEEGAAKSRYPPKYDYQITDKITCRMKNMPFYEYIFFPNKNAISSLKEWSNSMNNLGLINVIDYKDKYGPFNNIYNNNLLKMKNIQIHSNKGLIHLVNKNTEISGFRNIHELDKVSDLIPTIIKYLNNGNNVIYIPKDSTNSSIKRVKEISKKSECSLLCRNNNILTTHYKKEYILNIDKNYPIYFKNNDILVHLLYMSNTISNISKNFSSSFIFPSRIRCEWI